MNPFLKGSAMILMAFAAACASSQSGEPPATPAPAPQAAAAAPSVLVGDVTREQVEAAVPDWVQTEVESHPDAEAAQALAAAAAAADIEAGTEVTVFLGTWCGDSRRELARLWRAFDEAGGGEPFPIHYIAIDRQKKEPAGPIAEAGILYVPTFIVRRGGQEVGRIVETSPHGVETDLLALLTGKAQGLLTASRPELTHESSGSVSRPPA